MKRPLESDFFVVLKQAVHANTKSTDSSAESLRLTLFRDTLTRMAEVDQSSVQNVLNNLKMYVDSHHQDYSMEMMRCR